MRVLIRAKDTEIDAKGMSHEDRGRDWNDATTNQGIEGAIKNWRGKDSPLEPLEGKRPCYTAISDLWLQEYERINLYYLIHPFFGNLLQKH